MPRQFKIANTDIVASNITLGGMGVGGGVKYPDADDAESVRAIQEALDAGITFIDTAPVYGFGHSEEVVGRALKGRRDQAVISTKCGLWWGDDEGSYRFTWGGVRVKRNLSPRTLRIELEESLRRLDTDYIDVYYVHNPACEPFLTPVEETIDTLNSFVQEGKVRTLGVSNCDAAYVDSFRERGVLSMVQRHYSIVDHDVDKDVFAHARELGLSLHGYSSLEKGLLAGSIKRGHDLAADEARNNAGSNPLGGIWHQPALDMAVDFAEALEREVAVPLGLKLSELAIAYDVAKGVNPIVGIRRPRHVASVVRGADADLGADVLAEIDRRADELAARVAQV